MKVAPAVRRETLKIALGTAVMTVMMIAVFLIIGRFDLTVLAGAALGYGIALLNFFLMALTVQKAADDMPPLPKEEQAPEETEDSDSDFDEKSLGIKQPLSEGARRAKQRIQLSYSLRMLMQGVLAIIGVTLPCFNSIAVLLPLLFPRLVISLYGIMQKRQTQQ